MRTSRQRRFGLPGSGDACITAAALRASRQRRWGGRIGNDAASPAPSASDTTSQPAGWAGDAGKAGHRDSPG
jgi:hypothetical protein